MHLESRGKSVICDSRALYWISIRVLFTYVLKGDYMKYLLFFSSIEKKNFSFVVSMKKKS